MRGNRARWFPSRESSTLRAAPIPPSHFPHPFEMVLGAKRKANSGPLPTRYRPEVVCEGVFRHCAVLVEDSKAKQTIYLGGFFGKGVLSRGAPRIVQPLLDEEARTRRKRNSQRRGKEGNVGAEEPPPHPCEEEEQENKKRREHREEEDTVAKRALDVRQEIKEEHERFHEALRIMLAEHELLQLSLVEAFYLVHALKTLVVKDSHDRVMDEVECWKAFRASHGGHGDVTFLALYVAYQHLRSKGWVARSGLKYGADYVIYRYGPGYFHADHAVIVIPVHAETLREIEPVRRPLSWMIVQNLSRLSLQVAKGLLFLYVHIPPSFTEKDMESPACLSQIGIQETLVLRYNPDAGGPERHNKKGL